VNTFHDFPSKYSLFSGQKDLGVEGDALRHTSISFALISSFGRQRFLIPCFFFFFFFSPNGSYLKGPGSRFRSSAWRLFSPLPLLLILSQILSSRSPPSIRNFTQPSRSRRVNSPSFRPFVRLRGARSFLFLHPCCLDLDSSS